MFILYVKCNNFTIEKTLNMNRDELISKMVLKFLIHKYPIMRIKDISSNNRFGRGIILPDTNGVRFMLNNKKSIGFLLNKIIIDVTNIFGINNSLINDIIKKYLN
jgi:hypothetical protein